MENKYRTIKEVERQEERDETWVRKILTTEVKYIVVIVMFLVGVVAPYYSIKQDIALIKQNHLMHIENIERNIESLQEEQKDMKEIEIKLMQTISERLPK